MRQRRAEYADAALKCRFLTVRLRSAFVLERGRYGVQTRGTVTPQPPGERERGCRDMEYVLHASSERKKKGWSNNQSQASTAEVKSEDDQKNIDSSSSTFSSEKQEHT